LGVVALQQLQRENMALQAMLEAQQRQNDLLKQTLQHQQPASSSSPHPTSLLAAAAPTPTTLPVSQPTVPSFSPTVVSVGDPRLPAPVVPTTHTAVPSATQAVSVSLPAATQVVSSGGARSRSRSPSTDRPSASALSGAEAVSDPAVQVSP